MSELIPAHGGYRNLLSFQMAQLVYDVTVRFCERFVDRRSRTHDQMVQAARSGVQNIAEGSQTSATSKKSELRLTQVARASLEELRLDYEDFLRQQDFVKWGRRDPLRTELIARRFKTADQVAGWVAEVARRMDSPDGRAIPGVSANAALVLLAVACSLLDRQVQRLASDFEKNGGFSERLYRVRMQKRSGQSGQSPSSPPHPTPPSVLTPPRRASR